MLLKVVLSNFFSIKEEVELDLTAAAIKTKKAQQLESNVAELDSVSVLKSIALYGANASGKSNIIKAIHFCVHMILGSHLHNENVRFNFRPFKFGGYEKKPSRFTIHFLLEGIEYEYSFTLTVDSVITEDLYFYPNGRRKKIFTRDESLGTHKNEIYSFSNEIKRPMDVAENTSSKTLYISRASQMDRELPKAIFRYFNEVFLLGYKGMSVDFIQQLFGKYKNQLLHALQIADSDIVDVEIRRELVPIKGVNANFNQNTATVIEEKSERLRITSYHKSNPKVPFDFSSEESEGTQALFMFMLTILHVIKENKILLIDEIEQSLHTKIVEYIIGLFHASDCAQLIYSTHNTNLLDLDKLRKDQIYFVNKKKDGSTDLYSLFDYKDFRETMDVEKAYLQGRFDAIPIVDDAYHNLKDLLYGTKKKSI